MACRMTSKARKITENSERSEDLNASHYVSVRQVFLLLSVVLSIFFGYEIGNRPFADPDEGRYVEIPREMVATGDYVTPRLNGFKYFEKPPFFYWLQAASIKCVGISERSMRFWPGFFAVVGCLSVFGVGVICGSLSVGLVSAGILATNLLYYALSHIIILDLVVSVLISGVLWCFFLAFVARRRRRTEEKNSSKKGDKDKEGGTNVLSSRGRRIIITLMYALAALACLTKGLIGVILPGLIGFLWICFTRRWSTIREIFYIPGILLFLAVFLPWHVMVCSRNDDFFHFYFIVEHWLRYTTQFHKRYQPFWYFIPVILGGLLPWTGFSLNAIKNVIKKTMISNKRVTTEQRQYTRVVTASKAEEKSESIFLLCWIFGVLGFYSFSSSKLIPYILPVFPPIAFLTAQMLTKIEASSDPDFRIAACINVLCFIIAVAGFFSLRERISDVTCAFPDVLILMRFFAVLLGICVVLLVYLVCFRKRKTIGNFIVLYTFLAMNMMWILNKAAPYYQAIKKPSTRDMAEFVRMNFREENGDEIFCHKRYQQDFPIYLGRIVGVTDHLGELRFGSDAEKNDRMISEGQLWERWGRGDRRIFVLMTRIEYQQFFLKGIPHILLHFDNNFVVITNM